MDIAARGQHRTSTTECTGIASRDWTWIDLDFRFVLCLMVSSVQILYKKRTDSLKHLVKERTPITRQR